MLKACIGLNCARQIDYIDRRSCQLAEIPEEIYRHEATLEELILDSNMIQELPPKLFRMTNLRKLTLSENEIMRLSPMIANFTKLWELDISKNCLEEVPSNIQFCRSLCILDISCNPLLRIPDCVANVGSLTHLYINDVALPALPREIGNLQNLIVLEARENVMRRIPPSIGDLCRLQKLDLGNNEIEELPPTFGYLEDLSELWLDSNCLSLLPESLSRLRNLTILDVTKNKLERFPNHFANLVNLIDLHASENCIEALPENIGLMKSLAQIKLDLNHLVYLPDSIGSLTQATEIFLFENMLESIPSTIFNIPTLEMLNIDRNHIMEISPTVGKCKSLHVLSVRENELTILPEELGQLESLRVLDVCGNRLQYLPVSISNLQLDAFWISGNQPQPLISLHQEQHPSAPDKKVLTCNFLPQNGPESSEFDYIDNSDLESEESGFSQRKRQSGVRNSTRLTVAFDPGTAGLPAGEEGGGKFVRFPTPFRKELKNKHKKPKLDARPRTTVFRKGSMDDLTLHAVDQTGDNPPTGLTAGSQATAASSSPPLHHTNGKVRDNSNPVQDPWGSNSLLLKSYGVHNLSEGYIAGEEGGGTQEGETDSSHSTTEPVKTHSRSKLRTIEVAVELTKDNARFGLGFSIAGGKGSTPAYEDVDESIFITRIIRGGAAEKDGRLRLGDKLLSVNGQDMQDATHMYAVTTLRNTPKKCILKVSREVLVVLPDNAPLEEAEDDELQVTPPITNGDILRQTSTSDSHGETTPTPVSDGSHGNTPVTTRGLTGKIVVEAEVIAPSDGRDTDGEAVLLDSDDEILISEELILEQYIKHEVEEEEEQEVNQEEDQQEITQEGEQQEVTQEGEQQEVNQEVEQQEGEQQEVNQEGEQLEELKTEQQEIEEEQEQQETMEQEAKEKEEMTTSNQGKAKSNSYVNIEIAQSLMDEARAVQEAQEEEEEKEEKLRLERENILPIAAAIKTSTDSGLDSPDVVEEVVVLDRSYRTLGMSIVGGVDCINKIFGSGQLGVYISKVSPGGSAAATGKLRIGDRILSVNGVSMEGLTHDEAVDCLISQEEAIELTIRHDPQPKGMMEVYIEKGKNKKLGISIKGGAPGSHGNPLDKEDEGIFISKITRGEAAEKDGRLRVGHRILEVNGFSLLGARHVEAVHALRSVEDHVTLLVCHGYSFEEYMKNAQIRKLQRPTMTGSVDALDHDDEEKPKLSIKRTHSSNSVEGVKCKEEPSDLNSIIKQFRAAKATGAEEDLVRRDSQALEILEQSVVDMKEEADKLMEETVVTHPHINRKESIELARLRQEQKQEELQSIISEMFVNIDDQYSAPNNVDNATTHEASITQSSQAQGKDTEVQFVSLQVSPTSDKSSHRSCSTPPHMSLNDSSVKSHDVIPARPRSAEGRRTDAPVPAPKPLALISPEKLSFRERIALYQTKLNQDEAKRKADFRKSWAPGTMSPRSGSTSPVYTKWSSASTLGYNSYTEGFDKENSGRLSSPETNVKETPEVKMAATTATDHEMLSKKQGINESSNSVLSDPPLTDSPMSPPMTEDPGFSPVPIEEEDETEKVQKNKPSSIEAELQKNPYVLQMLEALPDGVNVDETELPAPSTEEEARRRLWREQKREEMNQELERVRELLTASDSSS